MGEIEEFNTLTFEKKLMQLKDTQESIQSLSAWCLKQRSHHKKIVSSWLNVLKRVKIEQRLVLFYLANDVIQYSKRKNYEFVESWGLNLQKATPLVRDEKVRHKILRIFKIWEQRSVYDDEFLSDLTGLLSAGATKKTDDDPLDFQPQQLVNKIKQCSVLEADTDQRLKIIHDSHLQLTDAEELCASFKDRNNKDEVEKELNEGIACVEKYTQALQREIVAREALLALLTSANQYYSTQRGEVKVVAYAYKNFASRVRALKRKLDELSTQLPSRAPSPPRAEEVPSPGPDEDLDLDLPPTEPDLDVSYNIDKTFNTSFADGSLYSLGLSSFLTSENPLSLFNENSQPDNVVPTENQQTQDALPGLDLLTPESTGNPPPPISFYGSIDTIEEPEPYMPEATTPWSNNAWGLPMEEPRSILPPPPPPPSLPLLSRLEDVDHRMLPALNMPPPSLMPPPPQVLPQQDVDHRNLISLTNQVPPPLRPVVTSLNADQDYRVPPPMVNPSDIVESVDMDLSEDEEQQGMYPNQQRHFNNNKVLVGGDNGKTIHDPKNLIRINSVPDMYQRKSPEQPLSAPILPNINIPPPLKAFNAFPNFQEDIQEEKEDPYEEDLHTRGIVDDVRNPSPPHFDDFPNNSEWNSPRPFMNQRFPRNWSPRTNFRPQNFGPNQFWPRNGPRLPNNRWNSPRPQRFW